ncbi:putative transmembrane protein [Sesbania bispinosa]|nr:putative transmembrane protein [Sesbania bispinosa]
MLWISQRVPEILPTSQSVPEVLQTSQRFLQVTMQTSQRLFQAKMMWRLVGFVSSVVGLLCYALSPSFNRLIGGWNIFKLFLYVVLSLVVCATILFAKQSSLLTQHVQLQMCMSSAVLIIISVYSFFYDKAVSGRPETLSLVSNAAFALVSLSLSRLIQFRFDMGIFSYFVGCLTIQLVTINWKLILVAIIFGCPLLIMHSFSDCRLKAGGQVIHSYSDSQPDTGDEGHVVHSSLNSQPEVGRFGQHVIDIHT